mmetsp:Transcript_23132/g.63876  ORF Transcript_23132/g.63876 Transcript_23132/m.63876 type:complete len:207 (+) Transcript_23132:202-822(+)
MLICTKSAPYEDLTRLRTSISSVLSSPSTSIFANRQPVWGYSHTEHCTLACHHAPQRQGDRQEQQHCLENVLLLATSKPAALHLSSLPPSDSASELHDLSCLSLEAFFFPVTCNLSLSARGSGIEPGLYLCSKSKQGTNRVRTIIMFQKQTGNGTAKQHIREQAVRGRPPTASTRQEGPSFRQACSALMQQHPTTQQSVKVCKCVG